MTDRAEVEVIAKPALPVIVHQGRYRLYKKPDGGLRLQYKRDDKDTEDFIELPALFVAMADKAAAGKMTPGDMVKAMMDMRK